MKFGREGNITPLDNKLFDLSDSYRVVNSGVVLPMSVYVQQYHRPETFIEYCCSCPRYGLTWSCPPFRFATENYLRPYDALWILATRLYPDPELNEWILSGRTQAKELYDGLIRCQRQKLDRRLLGLETTFGGARAAFAGHCHWCPPSRCTRSQGKPCRYLHKMRPSLEALGFDLCATTTQLLGIEMQWSEKGLLPEYYCLISALFLPPSAHPHSSDLLDRI
ncbi:MAG: DUF2284 domain-containing protein [Porphyromonas sp.]|nr:DUF2284 domain-containing protein [Porphyromonas sp.]